MDFSFLDKEEYSDIWMGRIEDNKNNLPFYVARMDVCNKLMHRHEYVQINYLMKGRLKHVINQNAFDVYKGDIFIIPPYVPHRFIDEKEESFELIELEFVPDFINERFASPTDTSGFRDFAYLEPFLVAENKVKPRLNLSGNLMTAAEEILLEIIGEYEKKDTDFELSIKALILRLLVLVGREYKKGGGQIEYQVVVERHKNALQDTLRYIDEHFTQDITAESAARMAMVSSSYFRYLFKQITGKTFIEYLRALRITRAMDILQNAPDKKVIDVCLEVGYQNVNHFNRIFRQETGLSPKQVRCARTK